MPSPRHLHVGLVHFSPEEGRRRGQGAARAPWLDLCATGFVGGLLLVTTLRVAQVGVKALRSERERPADENREDEDG